LFIMGQPKLVFRDKKMKKSKKERNSEGRKKRNPDGYSQHKTIS